MCDWTEVGAPYFQEINMRVMCPCFSLKKEAAHMLRLIARSAGTLKRSYLERGFKVAP
jgi:hypothetical protein